MTQHHNCLESQAFQRCRPNLVILLSYLSSGNPEKDGFLSGDRISHIHKAVSSSIPGVNSQRLLICFDRCSTCADHHARPITDAIWADSGAGASLSRASRCGAKPSHHLLALPWLLHFTADDGFLQRTVYALKTPVSLQSFAPLQRPINLLMRWLVRRSTKLNLAN